VAKQQNTNGEVEIWEMDEAKVMDTGSPGNPGASWLAIARSVNVRRPGSRLAYGNQTQIGNGAQKNISIGQCDPTTFIGDGEGGAFQSAARIGLS
jgi:hypothetical protein